MKIAVFHELDEGGARRGTNGFSYALKKKGHTIDLFYIDKSDNKEERKYYSNIYYYLFQPKQWSGGNWKVKLYKDTVELYNLYALHKKIANTINRGAHDFVFIHGSKFTQAPFILRFLKTFKIYYCQEPLRMVYESLFEIPKDLHPIKKRYEQMMRNVRKMIDEKNIKHADLIFANSNFTKQNIFNSYGIKATVCHMGVDTSLFYPEAKKSMDILFIGSKDEFDGYPLFQESIKHMKQKANVRYLIRGENWVANDKQLRQLYSQSRIVICFGYNEPFGLIPLEAMACGAVVVALDEGGYKDSVKDNKTGVLVKGNPAFIAKILDNLLQSRATLARLSKSAVTDMLKNWKWERGAAQILDTYKKHEDINNHCSL